MTLRETLQKMVEEGDSSKLSYGEKVSEPRFNSLSKEINL